MMSRAAVAEYRRGEAKKHGFENLNYPEFTKLPELDTALLIGRAKSLETTAENEKLSLRLASVLVLAGRRQEAAEIVERAFVKAERRAGTGDKFDKQHRAAQRALSYVPAFAECGDIERAVKIAKGSKNDGYFSDATRLHAHVLLAEAQHRFGDKAAGVKLLSEIIDGRAALEGMENDARSSETALSAVTITALEFGEFQLASRAALARDPKKDVYQRTATYLRGAVAATLLAAGRTKEGEEMFARAAEGPESSIRNSSVQEYRVAAELELGHPTAVKRVKFPDRRYDSINERAHDMIGVSLVNYHERRGEFVEMTNAARGLSVVGFTDAAMRAFNLHIKAGRLLEAMDYLCMVESEQLLHNQDELWHRLLVAGSKAGLKAIVKVASTRVVENLDSGRLLGADGKHWSLHLTPLAQTHIELGNIKAAERVTSTEFLHGATSKSMAEALGLAVVRALEERFPLKPTSHRVFPICWLSMRD